MKLAIATAVTQKCDLLLLDEPTNHLDVASVQWLADYLVTLKHTTCCIVSHDYAFLRKTCTDVMHIANLVRRLGSPPPTARGGRRSQHIRCVQSERSIFAVHDRSSS
jgi:ATPase subunit of ABC transporter with duplicated ATPase domains